MLTSLKALLKRTPWGQAYSQHRQRRDFWKWTVWYWTHSIPAAVLFAGDCGAVARIIKVSQGWKEYYGCFLDISCKKRRRDLQHGTTLSFYVHGVSQFHWRSAVAAAATTTTKTTKTAAANGYRRTCCRFFWFCFSVQAVKTNIPIRPTTIHAMRMPKLRPRWFLVPKMIVRAPWI